ncbi:basic proline-rich protein-like [Lathamus discolor]|uniref:basic proline-rich protein-like n=1 Tax=Lathamus discolor TaxID=678569 RepID=UPI0032B8315A
MHHPASARVRSPSLQTRDVTKVSPRRVGSAGVKPPMENNPAPHLKMFRFEAHRRAPGTAPRGSGTAGSRRGWGAGGTCHSPPQESPRRRPPSNPRAPRKRHRTALLPAPPPVRRSGPQPRPAPPAVRVPPPRARRRRAGQTLPNFSFPFFSLCPGPPASPTRAGIGRGGGGGQGSEAGPAAGSSAAAGVSLRWPGSSGSGSARRSSAPPAARRSAPPASVNHRGGGPRHGPRVPPPRPRGATPKERDRLTHGSAAGEAGDTSGFRGAGEVNCTEVQVVFSPIRMCAAVPVCVCGVSAPPPPRLFRPLGRGGALCPWGRPGGAVGAVRRRWRGTGCGGGGGGGNPRPASPPAPCLLPPACAAAGLYGGVGGQTEGRLCVCMTVCGGGADEVEVPGRVAGCIHLCPPPPPCERDQSSATALTAFPAYRAPRSPPAPPRSLFPSSFPRSFIPTPAPAAPPPPPTPAAAPRQAAPHGHRPFKAAEAEAPQPRWRLPRDRVARARVGIPRGRLPALLPPHGCPVGARCRRSSPPRLSLLVLHLAPRAPQ